MAQQQAQGFKVYLGEREVLIREMKIRDQKLALQAVGNRAGDNKFLLMTMLQEELLKMLLHSVDGKPVNQAQLTDLDSLFNIKEYAILQNVIGKISGIEDTNSLPQIENVFIGGK